MNWDLLDFLVFGGLVTGVGIALWLTMRLSGSAAYRLAAGIALLTTFLLLWMNGAVGIIGDANNDANMLFLGVPAVAFIGALISRFRPRGMALALLAAALAQALIPAVAITTRIDTTEPVWAQDVLILTGFFVALWLSSARFFYKAGQAPLAH